MMLNEFPLSGWSGAGRGVWECLALSRAGLAGDSVISNAEFINVRSYFLI